MNTHTHARAHTHTRTHTHTCHDSFTHTWTHTHARARTHTRTHAHMHTHTHMPWLIYMCAMPQSHGTQSHLCHSYMWHDSCICVPWLIHICAMTHQPWLIHTFINVPWVIHMFAVIVMISITSNVPWVIHMFARESFMCLPFICLPRLIHVWPCVHTTQPGRSSAAAIMDCLIFTSCQFFFNRYTCIFV